MQADLAQIHDDACPVEINDLHLSLEERPVLSGISLSLKARRVGIIGRNGSGKTSLARVLCGLIKPDQGKVTVAGIDVLNDRKGALSRIGIIFQNPDHQIIFPTVEEEIVFGVRQQGHDKEAALSIAHRTLDRFGVKAWAARPVATLSQGQKHLVCLMSVLAMRPAVIVLDEPFTGLDYPTAHHLRRVLDGLAETVVQITHDLRGLTGYDRVIWIDRGKIKSDGPAQEVCALYRDAMKRMAEGTDAITDITD